MPLEPPAMTAQEIADYPHAAPTVRVNCYEHATCLFVGMATPDRGADAVFTAAGCRSNPRTCPGVNPPPDPVETVHVGIGEVIAMPPIPLDEVPQGVSVPAADATGA